MSLLAAFTSAVPLDFGGQQANFNKMVSPQLQKSLNALGQKLRNKAVGGAQGLANKHNIKVDVNQMANNIANAAKAQAGNAQKRLQGQQGNVNRARQQFEGMAGQG